jgi:phosphopantothenoylcysteine decarboxylase/phosphopantothenate--cysteine ligase
MSLIALGVTGGISAYKSVEVCRGLQNRGHDVVAVMTRSAARFVGPLTFEAITRREVITSQWKPGANASIEHISLASDIALLLVAPCTANVIGKFANGIADDFLSSLYLATQAPVLLAPAMNTNMLAHPAVQRNLDELTARGVRFVPPGEGYLACGWIGKGRLAEPNAIVEAALAVLTPGSKALTGRRVVVAAGPTYEDIDPVRYIGNRSSGRMGFALAAEAKQRGATVTVVAGPTSLPAPIVDAVIRVRSAAQMHAAVMRAAEGADVIVMAAAVADYAPASVAADKIGKSSASLTLTLERTPDILAALGSRAVEADAPAPVLVGFAAETLDTVARARAKRVAKHVDLIVANDVSRSDAGFDVETNAVTIISERGEEDIPLQSKAGVAAIVLDRVEDILRERQRTPVRA